MLRWGFKVLSLIVICLYLTSCGRHNPTKTNELKKILEEKMGMESNVKPLIEEKVGNEGITLFAAYNPVYNWMYLIEPKEDPQFAITFTGESRAYFDTTRLRRLIHDMKIKDELEKDFNIDFYGGEKENSYVMLTAYFENTEHKISNFNDLTIKEVIKNSDNFENKNFHFSIYVTRFVNINNELIRNEFNYINKLFTSLGSIGKNTEVEIHFEYYDEKYKNDFLKTTESGNNYPVFTDKPNSVRILNIFDFKEMSSQNKDKSLEVFTKWMENMDQPFKPYDK
ncbi:MAG: hypothetical protein AB6733_13680 [Clostridiaceae bacterium]